MKTEDDDAIMGTVASPDGGGLSTTATVTGARASPDGEGLSTTALSTGLCQREAYCLLVQVVHNVDCVSALDAKVPDYVWTEVIAREICTLGVGAPAGTFTIELLSDTGFLLFQGPQSGRGMTWKKTILYVRDLHGIRDWGGMEVTMVAGQHSMKKSRIDLANTREYCQAHTLGQFATAEGRLQALAVEKANPQHPSLEAGGTPEGLTVTLHRRWSEPRHRNLPYML